MMLSDWIVMTPCFLTASVAAEITRPFCAGGQVALPCRKPSTSHFLFVPRYL